MKYIKMCFAVLFAALIMILQIPATQTDAASSAPNSSAQNEELGSGKVVGNNAVIFMDNTSMHVQEGTFAPGSGVISETDGKLSKYAIVDQKIVADQAYYGAAGMTYINLPDTLLEIGMFSFARSGLIQISIPEGTLGIGYGAFYHCDDLFSVSLPETIMNVEPKAFSYTAWLTDFLENGVSDFLISGGVLVACRSTYTDVVIPEGVRVIAGEAFAGHSEIKSVSLPDSLLVIGEGAFEGCDNLETVTGGMNVTQIKDRAFSGCPLSTVHIPESVEEAGPGAFDYSQTEKEPAARVVVFQGNKLPRLSNEVSAERLSNESYRVTALEAVEFAVINQVLNREDLEDTVLLSDRAPFQGIIGSLDSSGTYIMRYTNLTAEQLAALSIPDEITVDGSVYAVTGRDELISLAEPEVVPEAGSILITGEAAGAEAAMEEEDAGYILDITSAEDIQKLEAAYNRVYRTNLPKENVIYDITLMDGNNKLPISILGNKSLTIIIPVPNELHGRDLYVITTDRNGQLENIPYELYGDEESTYIRFSLSYLSILGLYTN